MTMQRLLWGMMWRSGAWGLLAGTILGAAYGILFSSILNLVGIHRGNLFILTPTQVGWHFIMLVMFIGAILGILFGAPTGIIVGISNGVVLAVLMRLFFYPYKNSRAYHWIVFGVNIVFSIITSWLFLITIAYFWINRYINIFPQLAVLVLIPALIAGVSAGLLSRRITRWYEKQSLQP